MKRIHIFPTIDDGPDPGNGGIFRVVVGQKQAMANHGWEIVNDPTMADVIACHVTVPETYLNRFNKPLVVHNHGLYWTEYSWGASWCYKVNQEAMAAIRIADAVTAVSDWTAQAIRRNSMRDVRVIYHGVDTDEWTPHENPGRYVLWNKSRIDPICDPKPIELLATEMPEQRFVSTFVRENEELPNLELTGLLSYETMKERTRRAAVYLCTTRETFGIGTLEAMAAGVPVVGYDWGGQREIIEHGVDGWLVEPENIEALVEGIDWALTNRDKIGVAARRKASQFTVERAAESYAEVYEEAIDRHRTGHVFGGADLQQEQPRVSVIVTAYDLEAYLPACLDSVAAQHEENWECIVVVDASPDDCAAIAQRYAAEDQRFRVIENRENVYLAESRNIGMRAARGRFLIPLDADDRLAPRTLDVLAGELDRDRGIDIAYGNVMFFEEDQKTPKHYGDRFDRGHSGWPVEFRLDWMLRGPGQLLPYCSMFRYKVWELSGGYRRRCRSSEDADFWLRTTSYGFVPKMVTKADTLLYTVRDDSMSSAQGEGWEEHRGWFPWAGEDGAIADIPSAAVQMEQDLGKLPMPSRDPTFIAIVIPVGPGHGIYVMDAVDSVDAQTFREWECIVVRDSPEPLPRLPSWVRVMCSDPSCPCAHGDPCHYEGPDAQELVPRGVAVARNKGIRESHSPLFLPLDADDFLQAHALEVMFKAHISIPSHPIVYSDFWEDVHGDWTIFEMDDYEPENLLRKGTLHCVTALTPKHVWKEVGGYPEDLPWEDWAFQIHCAAIGYCSIRVAEPLFSYRKHTGLRRTQNLQDFEASKRAIMEHDFGTKGGPLMACGKCGSGQQTTIGATALLGNRNAPPDADAVLITYTGNRQGNMTFRSKLNPQIEYVFSALRPTRWVHKQDAEIFTTRPEFKEEEWTAPDLTSEPELVASRTPVMAGAERGQQGFGTPEPRPEEQPAVVEPAAVEPEKPAESEQTPIPAVVELVKAHTRPALNEMARDLGIESPEKLKNMTEVAGAIHAVRMTNAAFNNPQRPFQGGEMATPV